MTQQMRASDRGGNVTRFRCRAAALVLMLAPAIVLTTPAQASTSWSSVSSGGSDTCGIKSIGSLYRWGINDNGQLGVGDTTGRTSPTGVL